MGMNSKRYCPSWLVYAVRVKFVPAFTAVTFAPGTTAPLLSATVPYKVVVVCACSAAIPKPAHKASAASKDVLVIGNLPAQPGADEKNTTPIAYTAPNVSSTNPDAEVPGRSATVLQTLRTCLLA